MKRNYVSPTVIITVYNKGKTKNKLRKVQGTKINGNIFFTMNLKKEKLFESTRCLNKNSLYTRESSCPKRTANKNENCSNYFCVEKRYLMGNDISYSDIYEYGYYDSQVDTFREQEEISVFFCSSDQCNLFFRRVVAYTERETEMSLTLLPTNTRTCDIVIQEPEETVSANYTSRIYSWIQSASSLLIDLEGSFVVRRVRELASKQQVLQCIPKTSNLKVDCKPRILGLDANKIQRSSPSLYIRSLSVQNQMKMLTSLKKSSGRGKCSFDELYCAICLEVFCRPVVTECWHIFCVDCIKSSLHRKNSCPLCRASIQLQSLQALDSVKKNHHIKQIQKQFLSLFVECPKCLWNGRMYEWNYHRTLCFRQEIGKF